jgi:hypothetical protein
MLYTGGLKPYNFIIGRDHLARPRHREKDDIGTYFKAQGVRLDVNVVGSG